MMSVYSGENFLKKYVYHSKKSMFVKNKNEKKIIQNKQKLFFRENFFSVKFLFDSIIRLNFEFRMIFFVDRMSTNDNFYFDLNVYYNV